MEKLTKEEFLKQEIEKENKARAEETELKYQEYLKQLAEEEYKRSQEKITKQQEELERKCNKAEWEYRNLLPRAFKLFYSDIKVLHDKQLLIDYIEELKAFYKKANKKYLKREKEIQ